MAKRNRTQKVTAAPVKETARKPARKTKARKAMKIAPETVVEPIVTVQDMPEITPVFVRKPDRFEMAINVMADFLTMIEKRIVMAVTKVIA